MFTLQLTKPAKPHNLGNSSLMKALLTPVKKGPDASSGSPIYNEKIGGNSSGNDRLTMRGATKYERRTHRALRFPTEELQALFPAGCSVSSAFYDYELHEKSWGHNE